MSDVVESSPSRPPAPEADTGRLEGASKVRVFTVLALILLFSEVVPLQYTMVLAAVQRIGQSFPQAGNEVSWMIIILGLVGGSIAPLVSKMGDLYGKKKLLLWCSVAFLAGSVVCALTSDWAVFLLGRCLQSLALAMASIATGLIRDLMPRRFVPVAIGTLATGFGVSAVAAPLLGGVLTDHYSWRSIFWFLVIYTAVLIPLFWLLVPESRLRARQRLDWLGALLIAGGAGGVLVYLSNGQSWGWGRWSALGYLLGGVVLLVAFYAWEHRASDPMMDPKLLRAPRLSIVLAIGLLINMVIGVQAYAIPYMLQLSKPVVDHGVAEGFASAAHVPVSAVAPTLSFHGDLGYAAGLTLLGVAVHVIIWQALPSTVAGPLAGTWAKRVGLRRPYLISLVILTLSMAAYALWHGSWVSIMVISIVWGVGFGMYFAGTNNLVVEAVPADQQSISAGMLAVAQGFGNSVGVAVLTAITAAHPYQVVTAATPGHPSRTIDIPQVYTSTGWGVGFWVMAAFGLVAVVLAYVMKAGRTPATGGLLH